MHRQLKRVVFCGVVWCGFPAITFAQAIYSQNGEHRPPAAYTQSFEKTQPALDSSNELLTDLLKNANSGVAPALSIDLQTERRNDWVCIRGQDEAPEEAGDPSDPTQTVFHVVTEFEWTHLRDGQGDLAAFKLSPFIPFELLDEKFLFNFEVPLQHADTVPTGANTGIGDTRMKLFWLIGTDDEFVRAIVPSFDAIAPTGDDQKGTGGGSWILMPNIVFALQPTEKLSIYPFFKYVYSGGPRSAFVPDAGLPGLPDFMSGSQKVNGFNMEVMFVFGLENAVMEWVSVTPDYFQNFSGDHGNTFTMKYDTGVAVGESTYLILAFWHPVGGDITNDFTLKLSLDFYL